MIRRFGDPKKAGVTYTLRPGAYAILPKGQDFLLTRQVLEEAEIQLPGGGIDPGETPIAALYREVMEETGWHIDRPRFLLSWRRFTWMPEYALWAEKVCHIFVANPVRPHSPPIEVGHEALWMAPDEALAALANEGDAHSLACWLSRRQTLARRPRRHQENRLHRKTR